MNANIMNTQKFNIQVFLTLFLLNTFIYESILIKNYKNAIMNTQMFYLNKYDLKGHKSSIIKFLSHFFLLPNTFIYESIDKKKI